MQNRRYVIQEHTTAAGIHWDLMFEEGDALTTFRLERMPASSGTEKIRAEKIFDHPLRFLTYEGPVQQGAGLVRIADRGACRTEKWDDEAIVVKLTGNVLTGEFVLTRINETLWDLTPAARPAQK